MRTVEVDNCHLLLEHDNSFNNQPLERVMIILPCCMSLLFLPYVFFESQWLFRAQGIFVNFKQALLAVNLFHPAMGCLETTVSWYRNGTLWFFQYGNVAFEHPDNIIIYLYFLDFDRLHFVSFYVELQGDGLLSTKRSCWVQHSVQQNSLQTHRDICCFIPSKSQG